MRYFKGQCDPNLGCYYRVLPNDVYQYYERGRWYDGRYMSWTNRCRVWVQQPIEVSKLEVLVVLGAHAAEDR